MSTNRRETPLTACEFIVYKNDEKIKQTNKQAKTLLLHCMYLIDYWVTKNRTICHPH